MAHDPDGRKALQVPGTASTLPALRDRSKIEAAIARGRASMAERQQASERVLPVPPPVSTPRVETVRVQAFCSIHGRPNIVIAERRGDALRFIGNERAADAGANGKAPALLSDKYKIDMNDWR